MTFKKSKNNAFKLSNLEDSAKSVMRKIREMTNLM